MPCVPVTLGHLGHPGPRITVVTHVPDTSQPSPVSEGMMDQHIILKAAPFFGVDGLFGR